MIDLIDINKQIHMQKQEEELDAHRFRVMHSTSNLSLGGGSAARIWVGHTIFHGGSIGIDASSRFPAKNPGARAFREKISLHKPLA
jgi:hypothetical protein